MSSIGREAGQTQQQLPQTQRDMLSVVVNRYGNQSENKYGKSLTSSSPSRNNY